MKKEIGIFEIPCSFNLFGESINIVFDENLVFDDDSKGQARFRRNEIRLLKKENGRPFSQIEQTFFHELVHWILYKMNEHDLGDNEKFVDVFANLLHQVFKTAIYEDDGELNADQESKRRLENCQC